MSEASEMEQWSVEKALSSFVPPTDQLATRTTSPIPFFHLLFQLKSTPRAGWLRFGLGTSSAPSPGSTATDPNGPVLTPNRAESIADHMYRMSMMCMFAPPSLTKPLNGIEAVDVSRAMKLALVHDLAESIVGDITPIDGVPKAEKHRRESTTIDWIAQELCGEVEGIGPNGLPQKGAAGAEICELWNEYENGQTRTSQFVKDLDKLELVLQAIEYEKHSGGRRELGEFMWVCHKVVLPEMKVWCQELIQERQSFRQSSQAPKLARTISQEEEQKKRDLVDQYYA